MDSDKLDSIEFNYDKKEKIVEIFKKIPRKYTKRLIAFGYQSIGGSEVLDLTDAYSTRNNIRQLFIESDGWYCTSDKCDPCVASGILFYEPILITETEETFFEIYIKVKSCCEKAGYHTLNSLTGI